MKPGEGWCAEPCMQWGSCRGWGTGSLVPSGAATRSQVRGLSGHSEAAQEPWEGQLFAGFTGPLFSTFGFSDNQYLPSCSTKPECWEAHWGKERRGSWGLTRLRITACRIPSTQRLQHPGSSHSQEHTLENQASALHPHPHPPPRGIGDTSQADHELPEFRCQGSHPSISAGLPATTHSSTGHDRLTT